MPSSTTSRNRYRRVLSFLKEENPGGLTLFSERYETLQCIGEGASATVYRARDRRTDRIVALKVLKEQMVHDPEGRVRFDREARAIARLSHPNIATLYEASDDGKHLYLAMEHVEGRSLKDLVRERRLDRREIVQIMERVAHAVRHAHQRGVIHRDLKPSNILIDCEGQPRIVDFGVAQMSYTEDLTLTGVPVGTPSYMAPEQVLGHRDQITQSVDIYGLGAILYEALTGRRPYQGETTAEIYQRIQREHPPLPRSVNPSIPAELEAIVLKAMERNPVRRYATASAMARDLRRFRRGRPLRSTPAPLPLHLRRWFISHLRPLGVLALALLLGWLAWRTWVSYAPAAAPLEEEAPRQYEEPSRPLWERD